MGPEAGELLALTSGPATAAAGSYVRHQAAVVRAAATTEPVYEARSRGRRERRRTEGERQRRGAAATSGHALRAGRSLDELNASCVGGTARWRGYGSRPTRRRSHHRGNRPEGAARPEPPRRERTVHRRTRRGERRPPVPPLGVDVQVRWDAPDAPRGGGGAVTPPPRRRCPVGVAPGAQPVSAPHDEAAAQCARVGPNHRVGRGRHAEREIRATAHQGAWRSCAAPQEAVPARQRPASRTAPAPRPVPPPRSRRGPPRAPPTDVHDDIRRPPVPRRSEPPRAARHRAVRHGRGPPDDHPGDRSPAPPEPTPTRTSHRRADRPPPPRQAEIDQTRRSGRLGPPRSPGPSRRARRRPHDAPTRTSPNGPPGDGRATSPPPRGGGDPRRHRDPSAAPDLA